MKPQTCGPGYHVATDPPSDQCQCGAHDLQRGGALSVAVAERRREQTERTDPAGRPFKGWHNPFHRRDLWTINALVRWAGTHEPTTGASMTLYDALRFIRDCVLDGRLTLGNNRRRAPLSTLEQLEAIRGRATIYAINYRNAGVGFCFFEPPPEFDVESAIDLAGIGLGAPWGDYLVVHGYYPTFEAAVASEYARLTSNQEQP